MTKTDHALSGGLSQWRAICRSSNRGNKLFPLSLCPANGGASFWSKPQICVVVAGEPKELVASLEVVDIVRVLVAVLS